jgi:hypothetical protein
MMYVVFLCTAYVGRPDLDTCQQGTLWTYQTPEQCKAAIVDLRSTEGKNGLEGDGGNRMSDGSVLRWHREYVFKGHPTWTDVQ